MPAPEHIHEAVMEILRAGDHYRGSYRSAFTFSAAEAVQQAKAPAVVMTSKQDVLYPGMAWMPTPAASVRTMEPDLVKHLAVPNLVFLEEGARQEYLERYTPEIVIDEYGGHFIKAWNMVRDQTLYALRL